MVDLCQKTDLKKVASHSQMSIPALGINVVHCAIISGVSLSPFLPFSYYYPLSGNELQGKKLIQSSPTSFLNGTRLPKLNPLHSSPNRINLRFCTSMCVRKHTLIMLHCSIAEIFLFENAGLIPGAPFIMVCPQCSILSELILNSLIYVQVMDDQNTSKQITFESLSKGKIKIIMLLFKYD